MGKIFNLDAPVIRFLGKVGEIMMLTVLWLLCCLPFFTVGAATAALYRLMFNLKEDRSTKVSDYFRAFQENFKKGTLLWLVLLAVVALLAVLYWLIAWVESDLIRLVLLVAFSAMFFVAFIAAVYLFPLTAFFENTVKGTLRNAVAMGMGHLRSSIPACALLLLPVVAALVSYDIFMRLLFLWLVLAPGAIAYGIVCILTPVFQKYSPEE